MSIQRTFAGSKYQSMFVSGTVMMVLTAVMGMIDTLIAGIMLGEDAVAGVFSLGPVYPDEIRPEELPAFPRGSGKKQKGRAVRFRGGTGNSDPRPG